MTDVSLDIEACGEVVLSIGACRFDIATGVAAESVYITFSDKAIQKQLDKGLRVSGEALVWWLGNERAAGRDGYFERVPYDSVPAALDDLRAITWKGTDGNYARVWAYPTSYDLAMIERLCRAFKIWVPWKWTETMDARTLWKLALRVNPSLEKLERESTVRHHALEDAKEQARWIARYYAAVLSANDCGRQEPGHHNA